MVAVSVESQTKELTKSLNDLQKKRVPFVVNQAINDVAKNAQKVSVKRVARDINVAQKLVKFRHDVRGNAKAPRSVLKKAGSRLRFATLTVWLRGIPVFQLRHSQAKGKTRGVRASGGRFYKGAFVGTTRRGQRLVLKARSTTALARGAEVGNKGRLFVPKIGVRRRLLKVYRKMTSGTTGRRLFQKTFKKRLDKELTKKGLR